MDDLIVCQDYDMYADEDHETWKMLMTRQSQLTSEIASREYLKGYGEFKLDNNKIVKIAELSRTLEELSGWSLVPVTGLISTKEFFHMIANRKYPITVYVRKRNDIEFSEQPDIFHDVCGHLPLLINKKFSEFLIAYSAISLKYIENDYAIELLGRLYWFTYEMGVIKEGENLRPYGGAILTSSQEIMNVQKNEVPKYVFDLKHIFNTRYNPYALQKEYFVIESFDELFYNIHKLESELRASIDAREQMSVLSDYSLNPSLKCDFGNVIGFLNDIQDKYPRAISFAAGKPDERLFNLERDLSKFYTYVNNRVDQVKGERTDIINRIGQYSSTKGIINDIISEYLKNDEGISISEKNIIITVGAQEAFCIIVSTICNRMDDVILLEEPSYIGLSSFAKIFNYGLDSVQTDENGMDLVALENKINQLKQINKTVKLVYVIPDYQNPTGSCMPIENRIKLLELARRYNFLIIEDTVYNIFSYDGKKNPSIKSLDKYSRVIYVGSFSKSLFPGLRIGLIASEQSILKKDGSLIRLIDEMAKVKAQITNSTPTITQAIVGGILLENGCSLFDLFRTKVERYKEKRQWMNECLKKFIYRDLSSFGVKWSEPSGGIFTKMSLPFEVDEGDVMECADRYGVIFTPMSFFYLGAGGKNELRLSFSCLTLSDIEMGVERLSLFLKSKIF